MNNAEKIALIEEMMELDEGTLKDDTILESLEEWNSMTAISLIVLIDEKFGKKLSADTIKSFVTISDILNYMTEEI